MLSKWSQEQAWAWYENQPWIVGCNYVPSCCINATEIWQEDGFENVFPVMQKEIALAASIGLNSVRMLVPFRLWKVQRTGLLERLERFLELLATHQMTLMPVFFDDCERGPIESYSASVRLGVQPAPEPGWHGGAAPRPRDGSANPSYHLADDTQNWPFMEEFVKEIVAAHRTDPRIVAWDIWNEPGNTGAGGYGGIEKSAEAMASVFGWARAMDPVQPLTAGCWDYYQNRLEGDQFKPLTPIEALAVDLSDVVSYHYYGDYAHSVRLVESLKQYGRPLFITEWLHRPFRNFVHDHLPLFQREKIACYHWGLVNGKTQTHEPWDWIADWDLDFSQWQHDLFRSDGTPYRPDEIDLFHHLTRATNAAKEMMQ